MVTHPVYPNIDLKPTLAYWDFDQTYDLVWAMQLPLGMSNIWSNYRVPCFELMLFDRFPPFAYPWADSYADSIYLWLKKYNFSPYTQIPAKGAQVIVPFVPNEIETFDPQDYPELDGLDYVGSYEPEIPVMIAFEPGEYIITFLILDDPPSINRSYLRLIFNENTSLDFEQFLREHPKDLKQWVACSFRFFRIDPSDSSILEYTPTDLQNSFWLYQELSNYLDFVEEQIVTYLDYLQSNVLFQNSAGDWVTGKNLMGVGATIISKEQQLTITPNNTHFLDQNFDYSYGEMSVVVQQFPAWYRNKCGLIRANNPSRNYNFGSNAEVESYLELEDLGQLPLITENGYSNTLDNLPENHAYVNGQLFGEEHFDKPQLVLFEERHYNYIHLLNVDRYYDAGYQLRDFGFIQSYVHNTFDHLLTSSPTEILNNATPDRDIANGFSLFRTTEDGAGEIRTFIDYAHEMFASAETTSTYAPMDDMGWLWFKGFVSEGFLPTFIQARYFPTDEILYRYSWWDVVFEYNFYWEGTELSAIAANTPLWYVKDGGNPTPSINIFDNTPFSKDVGITRVFYDQTEFDGAFYYDDLEESAKNDYVIEQGLNEVFDMADSVRIKEIHATLGADQWAYQGDSETPAYMNLGRKIDLIAKALGISFNLDGSIMSLRQRENIEYEDGEITIPAGWVRGQFGTNTGNSPVGQEGGLDGEERLGIAYQNRSNRYTNDAVCVDDTVEIEDPSNAIQQGDIVLCESLPQLIEALIDDLDKALNWQEMGAAIVPNADNSGKYCQFEGMGTLLADLSWTISSLSRNIIHSHAMNLKQEAILHQVLVALGVPITTGNLPVRVSNEGTEDERTANLIYPVVAPDTQSIVQLQYAILSNIAPLLANCMKYEEEDETE